MSKLSPSQPPFKAALAIAIVGLILTVIAIATPEWTYTNGVTIGLWSLTDESGQTFSWIGTGKYEDFFYANWFMAVRALIMAGIIISSFGILFNIYVLAKRRSSPHHGNVLFCYYLLAFALVVITAAVYSSLIPQGVTSSGYITDNKDVIVDYIYTAGYGYSLWICWLAGGVFLLAAGMAYEGSNQQAKAQKMVDYIMA